MRSLTRGLTLALAALILPGCGSSNDIRVTGKLLQGGAPYTPPEGQSVGVTFYSIGLKGGQGPGSEPFPAQFNPTDATFTVPGPDGRGIPPGEYRVAVIRRPKAGTTPTALPGRGAKRVERDHDFLNGQFGPTTSPITRALSSSCELTIDLDHPDE